MIFTIIMILIVTTIVAWHDKQARPFIKSVGQIVAYYLVIIVPVLLVLSVLLFALKLLQ